MSLTWHTCRHSLHLTHLVSQTVRGRVQCLLLAERQGQINTPDLLRSQIVGTKLRARCKRSHVSFACDLLRITVQMKTGATGCFACLNGELGRAESCKRKMKCDQVLVEEVNKYIEL